MKAHESSEFDTRYSRYPMSFSDAVAALFRVRFTRTIPVKAQCSEAVEQKTVTTAGGAEAGKASANKVSTAA